MARKITPSDALLLRCTSIDCVAICWLCKRLQCTVATDCSTRAAWLDCALHCSSAFISIFWVFFAFCFLRWNCCVYDTTCSNTELKIRALWKTACQTNIPFTLLSLCNRNCRTLIRAYFGVQYCVCKIDDTLYSSATAVVVAENGCCWSNWASWRVVWNWRRIRQSGMCRCHLVDLQNPAIAKRKRGSDSAK